jgi:hypothetical protein
VERKAPPRDAEAEALIREEIARQPGAPYYLAQTVLVQEHALSVAERRIQELEAALERASRDGSPGGLFGGRDRLSGRRQPDDRQPGPWERQERYGGGFLAGAAQTALGVTGGILLGNAIGSMFGAGAATAAEPADPAASESVESDPGAGNDDVGADAGDFGGFDTGGGFDFGGDF